MENTVKEINSTTQEHNENQQNNPKPIIHFKVPCLASKIGSQQDNYISSIKGIKYFVEFAREAVGDEYYVIASPFDCDVYGSNGIMLKYDGKDYTSDEIIGLIEESKNKDNLKSNYDGIAQDNLKGITCGETYKDAFIPNMKPKDDNK